MITFFSINKDYVAMLGREQNKQKHSHYGIQLLIPLSKININESVTRSPVFIDSHISHYVYGEAEIFSLLINPSSNLGRRIKQSFFHFENKEIVYINNFNLTRYAENMTKNMNNLADIQKNIDLIIKQLLIHTSQVEPLDERVSAVNHYIISNDFSTINYKDIIDSVFLSKSRFTHLFRDEIGIPLGKYIIWQKITHASIKLLTSETNITTVAHEYGFADASHFSRTFKENFGVSPSKIFNKRQKDGRLVHVLS